MSEESNKQCSICFRRYTEFGHPAEPVRSARVPVTVFGHGGLSNATGSIGGAGAGLGRVSDGAGGARATFQP
jgi:hypothetical protein